MLNHLSVEGLMDYIGIIMTISFNLNEERWKFRFFDESRFSFRSQRRFLSTTFDVHLLELFKFILRSEKMKSINNCLTCGFQSRIGLNGGHTSSK